ncbi:pyridoxamine 5'-phosphate oxidase family protein [Mesorhizobium sp. SB112]|uniref:pyridoxamine 5'-phosphate oxidase family protein n=1 Tax=Mesorhizobium sp. SB112 TaxID=3151853 RepID=UPI003263CA3C
MIVREMTHDECSAVIAASRLARLACALDNQPYLVPIHYAFAAGVLYSFSMPGQKIDWMRNNSKVCIQIDQFGEPREWRSVLVYGVFEELPDRIGWKHERDHAWSLLQKHANWWEPGALKPVLAPAAGTSSHLFYRIKAERITGRQAVDDTAFADL